MILPQGTTFFSYEIVPAFFPSLSLATESLQSQAGTDPSRRHRCETRALGSLWDRGSFGQRGGEDCFPPAQGIIATGDAERLIQEHLGAQGAPCVLKDIQPCDKAKALGCLAHLLPVPTECSWANHAGIVPMGRIFSLAVLA